MPQPYERAVLTNQGEKLLAKAAAGQGQIEYVCMAVGCGVYDVSEKECDVLKGREALKEEKNRYAFSCMNLEDKVVRLTALLTNQDPVTSAGLVTEGYYINEVGIFAKEKGMDNGTAILYSMCVTASSTGMGDYMPEYNGRNRSEITQDYILSVDDSVEIYVNMIGAVALAEDVERCKNDMRHHVADLDNPHRTDKIQVGLDRVDNTSDMEKPVSTLQQEAIDGAYQQSTGYTDQKIAALINGAPSTLDTLGEIARAMQDNDDVVQALEQAIGTKASQAELDGHTGNTTVHITASERQDWNEKQTTTGDTKDNVVSFTSGDTASPTGWSDVALISSGEKHNSLWHKVSLFARNMRYLWKLMGNTSLNGIGDGTVTGAISQLNTGISKNIRDTGWITLNADWGCRYRIKNGVFYLNLTAELPSGASIARHNLGTIPMASLNALNVPYIAVQEAFNLGTILISQSGPNIVEFEVKVSNRWYSATLAIPVGYL